MAAEAKTEKAPLVACPRCGSTGSLLEHAIRYTHQPVHGLRLDGDAEDYSSFDYGDDVIVQGYQCACGWMELAELWPHQLAVLGHKVQQIRNGMKQVAG